MRNRTADLLLTMETLCLLSYRGAQMPRDGRHQRTKIHTAPRPGRIRVITASGALLFTLFGIRRKAPATP